MVVLVFSVDAETNHNLVQEPVFTIFLAPGIKILSGVENKFVFTGNKISAIQKGAVATAIRISGRVANGACLPMAEKINTYRGPGAAIGGIQHMCG